MYDNMGETFSLWCDEFLHYESRSDLPQKLILTVRRQEEKSQADGSHLVDCLLAKVYRCQ